MTVRNVDEATVKEFAQLSARADRAMRRRNILWRLAQVAFGAVAVLLFVAGVWFTLARPEAEVDGFPTAALCFLLAGCAIWGAGNCFLAEMVLRDRAERRSERAFHDLALVSPVEADVFIARSRDREEWDRQRDRRRAAKVARAAAAKRVARRRAKRKPDRSR